MELPPSHPSGCCLLSANVRAGLGGESGNPAGAVVSAAAEALVGD